MTSPLITVVALTVLFLLFSTPVRSFGWQTTSDDSHASRKQVRGALELAQAPTSVPACDVGTVSFTLLPGPRTCALPFEAYLVTNDPSGACPLFATALTICDEFEQNCTTCTQNSQTALGILFTCLPLNSAGVQIVAANFSFGSLQNQRIATSDTFECPPPPFCPVNNINIPPTVECGNYQINVTESVPLPACRLDSISVSGFTLPDLSHFFGCDSGTIVSAVPKRVVLSCSGPSFSATGIVRFRAFFNYGNSLGSENFLTGISGDNTSCRIPPSPPPLAPVPPPLAPPIPPSFACDSSTVEFNLLPGPRECGQSFQAVLNTTLPLAACPLSSTGVTVCDANRNNCITCNNQTSSSSDIVFTCLPTNFNGFQVITSSYSLGPLTGVISTGDVFGGCVAPM